MNQGVRNSWATTLADAHEAQADAIDFAVDAMQAVQEALSEAAFNKLLIATQMLDLERQQHRKTAKVLREGGKEQAEQSVRPIRAG